MKYPIGHRASSGFLSSILLVQAFAFLGVFDHATAGASDDKPITMDSVVIKETKTHTLFMGADIAISLDRDLYPVRDVMGSSWVIDINHQDKVVSAKEAPMNLKITPTLKLTETAVTIAGFKKEPAYSYGNDPSVRLTKGLDSSSAMSTDLIDVARNAQAKQDTMANNGLGGAAVLAGSDDQFSFNAEFFGAQMRYAETHSFGVAKGGIPLPIASSVQPSMPSSGLGDVGLNLAHASNVSASTFAQTAPGNEPVGRIATRGFDAMEIDFDITSPKPLHNPYVVTMTRFHPAGSKQGFIQNLVYAQALNPIDAHHSRVHFVEDGFPFNYELIDFQLHIYDRGVEVATNLAADRVELTRDEAFEYIKSEYIGAHKGATLPAVAVMGNLPADLPTKLNAGKYDHPIFVSVSKDGLATGAFVDSSCQERIDDTYLDSVIGRIRFKPALTNGSPVAGVATLNLNKLTI
jgi:hypothetical protein